MNPYDPAHLTTIRRLRTRSNVERIDILVRQGSVYSFTSISKIFMVFTWVQRSALDPLLINYLFSSCKKYPNSCSCVFACLLLLFFNIHLFNFFQLI